MTTVEICHVVGAILYNDKGEVLLQQRDDKPGLRYAGQWTFFGGSVEDGETLDEAMSRELMEELALEMSLSLWLEYECPVRTVPGEMVTINHVYVGRIERDLSELALYEGQAMAYFNCEEASKLTLAFEQSPVLEQYFCEHPQEALR